jgi:transcriptional regulator with XRE-family HTH domain
MPNDADRTGTPAGVFGAELRFYRTRAGLSQKDLAALIHVSNDVISKIETGERTPAEDFPPRLDALPELDTRNALTRLWDNLKKGQKQRLYGWFQEWADIEAQATVLRWYEPLVVPGLLQTDDYARAILSARPDGNLSDLDEQVAARLARQNILTERVPPALVHSRRRRAAQSHRRPQGHAQPALPPRGGSRAPPDDYPGHPLRRRPRGPAGALRHRRP